MSDITLENRHGHRVVFSPLGAAISAIFVPDASGNVADITVQAGASAGKTIGRYANRIANGEFTLDGQKYLLATNENGNTLHGGPDGFSKRLWDVASSTGSSVEFLLQSPEGDQGFPGAVECRTRYSWNDDGALRLDYTAITTRPTVINLTNHVYLNLRADRAAGIADQQLQVAASAYTPLDGESIPTGEIAGVAGTSRDFRAMRAMTGEKFDCNFCLDGWDGSLRTAAHAWDPVSGRRITVETTQPGLQFFTGKPGAFALETQHYADAPHHPNFPSTVLRPGETFVSTTVYRFTT